MIREWPGNGIRRFALVRSDRMTMIVYLILLGLTLPLSSSIPIDNGVEGDPEIECAADSVAVNFNVRNEFQGHVYVKGRFAEGGECRTDGGASEGGRRVASIKLGFTACGTKRERSLNPKGVTVTNTVVITFHPQFLTKVDRAYTIQCFYMEADKTVSQELEVSDITTALQTAVAPMPVCRYEILDNGPNGQPVKFAEIGQQVYHKWTCDTETVDMFCALVHSCVVDDGAGSNVQLLNDQGCALDKHLLANLEYQTDLMAGHESHVFKYADKPALFFQCQITILGKEPGQPCNRPQCPEPGGPGSAGSNIGGGGVPSGVTPGPVGTAGTGRSTTTRRSTGAGTGTGSGTTPLAPAPNAAGSLTRRDQALPGGGRRAVASNGRVFRFRYARDVDAVEEERIHSVEEERIQSQIVSDIYGTMDVAAPTITAFDIGLNDSDIGDDLTRHQPGNSLAYGGVLLSSDQEGNGRLCLQLVPFAIMATVAMVCFISGVAAAVVLFMKKRTSK